MDGAAECGACSAGHFAESGDAGCTPCAAGTFVSSGSASSCLPCPDGNVAAAPGSTSCEVCPGGTRKISGTQCEDCTGGQYQSASDATTCIACPLGYFCPPGATLALACGAPVLYCPAESDAAVSVSEGYYSTPEDAASQTTRAFVKTSRLASRIAARAR